MRGMWFNYDPPVLCIFPAVEGGELTGVMLLFRALPVSAILRPAPHSSGANTDNNNTHNHGYNKITGLETQILLNLLLRPGNRNLVFRTELFFLRI